MLSNEGCLSFPEAYTSVRRYDHIVVKALDRHGKPFIIDAKDETLLVKAIQHENDHLDGILFIDHARNRFEADQILSQKGLPPVDPNFIIQEVELEAEIAKLGDVESK